MQQKVCSACKKRQATSEFSKSARHVDGLQPRCKSCARAWYEANRDEHKANTARRTREVRAGYRERLIAFLSDHPCVDCGEDDVVLLEFDHREPEGKVKEVARLISDLVSWQKIAEEIAKCDVCCANCHRRRTAERGGQRKHVQQQRRQVEQAQASQDRLRELFPGR